MRKIAAVTRITKWSAATIGVVQIGPRPGTPGGMASVIDEYLRLPLDSYALSSIATWEPGGVARKLRAALSGYFQMAMTRRRWSIAHVHLSEYGSFLREGLAVAFAKCMRAKVVITLHGAEFSDHIRRHPRLTKAVLGMSDYVACLGPSQVEIVRSLSPRIRTGITVNPLPDLKPADIKEGLPETYVLFVGEVGIRKGVDRLLRAYETVRSARRDLGLVIIGPATEPFAEQLDNHPYFLGEMERKDALAVMRGAAVTILPSRAEVLPMVLLESLSQGTPAIYTAVGEWTHFEHCEWVTLIEHDSRSEDDLVEALGVAISKVHAPNAEDRLAAADWVASFASPTTVARQLMKVYELVLAREAHGTNNSMEGSP